MNFFLYEIISNYLLITKKYLICNNLKLLCKDSKNSIYNNNLYYRHKSAYLLSKNIRQIFGYSKYNQNNFNMFEIFPLFKKDLSYLFKLFWLNYTGNNNIDKIFISYLNDYKNDKLNPFKNLRTFSHDHILKRIKSSTMLSLSLAHAEKPSNINFIKIMDSYSSYYFANNVKYYFI